MRKDNLEKYVKERRQEFDDKIPSASVWQNVSKGIPQGVSFNWIWKVAAVIFFCSTLYLVADKYNSPSHQELASEFHKLSEDFSDVEHYYFEIISDKRDIIYEYDDLENPIEVDFEQDLQKLDAMYEVLKEELRTNPSKKVVDALILNLLVRIDVLNQKIEELEVDSVLENSENDDTQI